MDDEKDKPTSPDPPQAEYPTEEQTDGCFNAWKTGGEEGIRQWLEAERAKRASN